MPRSPSTTQATRRTNAALESMRRLANTSDDLTNEQVEAIAQAVLTEAEYTAKALRDRKREPEAFSLAP